MNCRDRAPTSSEVVQLLIDVQRNVVPGGPQVHRDGKICVADMTVRAESHLQLHQKQIQEVYYRAQMLLPVKRTLERCRVCV